MALIYFILTGPTAAGKTAWLLEQAARHQLAVISADSRQAYRFMNIGTGKPTPVEQQMLPHYGLDYLVPGIPYSAHQFLEIAAAALSSIEKSGRIAWVAGGTGLYIRALLEGLPLGGRPRPQLRLALSERIRQQGARSVAAVLDLKPRDPDNPMRVIRQAELACSDSQRAKAIYAWAGLGVEAVQADGAPAPSGAAVRAELSRWRCGGIAVLDPGRTELLARIEKRVRAMFDEGLVEEVAGLRRLGYTAADVVRDGIGYREAGQVLDGELSRERAVELAVIRTRQYAKRQRTYFRGQQWPMLIESQLAVWWEERCPR